jgi:cation diffusion facilitator CzcD-associated flavoprotein CzcO
MRQRVVIIGGGLCVAIALLRAGHRDLLILEKAKDVGGVWRDNIYPGCCCDVPSHRYCYSFHLKPDWESHYAQQSEIQSYIHDVVRHYGLSSHIAFDTKVVSAEYRQDISCWLITTNRNSYVADALVVAVGPMHKPLIPDLPGLKLFTGAVFHSAEWDYSYDLSGKRVAVIGTGASAIQFIPEIVDDVAKLYVFQRTPPWVLPRNDRRYGRVSKLVFSRLSWSPRLYRAFLYWRAEAASLIFTWLVPLMWVMELKAGRNIRQHLSDRELRRLLTPSYRLGCKRVLRSDNYYPTFARDNVELVTSPIEILDTVAVTTSDGIRREVDAVILGTGFHVIDTFDQIDIVGASGTSLKETWQQHGMEAYLGVCVSGFPNLFLMLGPNSGLGHTSVIFIIEAQARLIVQLLDSISGPVAVGAAAQGRFNTMLQRRLMRTVWMKGGCTSYYMDSAGVNRALWPGSTVTYWRYTRRPRVRDFFEDSWRVQPAQD